MKLYSIQIKQEGPQKNLEKVLNFLKKVEENSLVLLPELWFSGFDFENINSLSEETPKILDKLKKISRKRKLTICGTFAKKRGGKLYNIAYLIEDGKIIGKRGKIKLFPIFNEDKYFTPWNKNQVFETKFGKVGILICFELRFTELVLELKREKPEVVLVPAQWGYARRKHLEILSRARAIELQSYLIVSNTWGDYLGTRYAGHSAIYSPWGEVLAFSEKGDTILEANYDKNYVYEVRKTIPID